MKRTGKCLLLWSLALAAAALGVFAGRPGAAQGPRLNVLFISVDDLRPQLGCYGDRIARSPNIDRLAARGLVFNRAYCQQAVCSPSRSSLMTGRRPDTTRVYDLETHFRTALPDVVTLAQHFKNNGYHTQSFGKIYHPGFNDPPSWSAPSSGPKAPRYGPEARALIARLTEEARNAGLDLKLRRNQPRGPAWEAPEVADAALVDGSLADQAVRALNEVKDRPFFLAVGFHNPHLPFVAPKKYWDLYSQEQIRPAGNPHPPEDAPAYALTSFGELRSYHGIPKKGPLSEEQARKMVHGYYAAVSYMDAQVGRLLDEVDRLSLRDRTVVILWGDHGWQLGEHGLWCKHTNYETSARAALLISTPGQKSAGRKTDALTEFVDVYPSLADLCGLPAPEGVEGISFKPLLDDPARPWKRAAFHQYPRQIPGAGPGMGYAIRTDRYHLVEWSVPGKEFREYELYDHRTDPGENVNLAKRPEHAALVKELAGQLHAGWRAAVPGRN
jgi:iduronate 2-sulfatase